MSLHPEVIYANAESAWPGVSRDDLIWVGPLGSRLDALVYHRRLHEVTTGRRGEGPCFKGTLDEFSENLEDDYGKRLEVPYGNAERLTRLRDEYRAAIAFFRMLPPI